MSRTHLLGLALENTGNWDGAIAEEREALHLNVNVPGIVFGEPIDRTDGGSGFEITIEGLSSAKICALLR